MDQVKEFIETSIGKAQAGDLAEIDIPLWRKSGEQTATANNLHIDIFLI